MIDRRAGWMLIVALAFSAAFLQSGSASAQEPTSNEVQATPKGTIGFGLLGAELGLVIPAVSGLDETWSLIVFPTVGAAGGAVAGYFLIDEPGRSEAAVALMAAGMALLVPAIVGTLAAIAYDPDEEADVEEGSAQSGSDADGEPDRAEPETVEEEDDWDNEARRRPLQLQSGLLQVGPTGFRVGVPGLTVGSTASAIEVQRYGASQAPEVHFSVVSGTF